MVRPLDESKALKTYGHGPWLVCEVVLIQLFKVVTWMHQDKGKQALIQVTFALKLQHFFRSLKSSLLLSTFPLFRRDSFVLVCPRAL